MNETCSECGASVSDYDKHRRWHSDLDRKIKEVFDEAGRAKRAAAG